MLKLVYPVTVPSAGVGLDTKVYCDRIVKLEAVLEKQIIMAHLSRLEGRETDEPL